MERVEANAPEPVSGLLTGGYIAAAVLAGGSRTGDSCSLQCLSL